MSTSEGNERVQQTQSPIREQGDGAPVVLQRSPLAGEQSGSLSPQTSQSGHGKPFTVRAEVDIVQLVLTLASIVTRTWRLGWPRAVVFDELHFSKFSALYLKNTFFFDVHPPLGKLLLALAGQYAGFEGNINVERIGQEFPASVPVEMMRACPAILGSLIVPLVYQICVESGMSRHSAAFAATLVLLDNALLVQSRFMLMEGILIFFSMLAILAFLKFRNTTTEFSVRWWFWLCLCGFSATCCLSVKYIGGFTLLLLVVLAAKDFWLLLDDKSKSDFILVKHLIGRLVAMVALPVLTYLGLFYIHLSILWKAGLHDNIMTSAFQASLEGGLATLTKGQPVEVAFGSQITLRHTENVGLGVGAGSPAGGHPCWLHSHAHMYPVRYPDQRGSSHQQQVTCYVFKDINNWWIVKHPGRQNLIVDDPPTPVRHGDIIQLVHGITSRALNTHDVAAPLTPNNQEVSCYVNYNVSMPAQDLWRVDIVNRETDDEKWQTIKSQVRLVHVNTSTALKATGRQLPEWGFHQIEVSADRLLQQRATVWNVEEHRYTRVHQDGQEVDLQQAELIPLQPTHLSFWAKLYELQMKMFISSQDVKLEHKYSSGPSDWPFSKRNIAYWMSPTDNNQIHLLGNLTIWVSSAIAVVCYITLVVCYLLRRQRALFDIPESQYRHFWFLGELFVGGYLLHYVPFFICDRTLFLHHYLPAVPFKMLALTALGDHLYTVAPRNSLLYQMIKFGAVVLLSAALHNFLSLAVFTFAIHAPSTQQIKDLKWLQTWDFLHH
ncbi:protein O-mannosyltransferase 1 [Elysia marginata]|uniref:dolichyl-phosphate-mannose--protein mannosyltransferase n=1 Tax=Elysia marginata TaxID=1093978 RepID=A0AAV4FVU6_9GAST|nr:protein O-mannosyltransferase 1 [Elysia marginata]